MFSQDPIHAYLLSLPGVVSDFKQGWNAKRYCLSGRCSPCGGITRTDGPCYPWLLPQQVAWVSIFLDMPFQEPLLHSLIGQAYDNWVKSLYKTAWSGIIGVT